MSNTSLPPVPSDRGPSQPSLASGAFPPPGDRPSQAFFGNIKGDLLGGLTAGIVALPLALAFGVASGLGAAAGLYGAIAVGILAALFGGTPAQVSGPTGPMTVVVAALIASGLKDPSLVFAAILLSGIFQIALAAARVGEYIRYIPYPVVSGFMSGVGVIIVCLQALPLLGVAGAPSVWGSLQALPGAIGNLNPAALGLGLGSIAIIYAVPRLTKAVPSALVALLVMSLISVAFKLDVPRIGAIPTGLPAFALPPLDLSIFAVIAVPALTLALLGAIDSLLTSLVADKITRTRHNSNRELLGQGLGNALSGLIGGLPGAGATMRTVVNVQSGGRGPLSGATHGVFLLAVLLGLGALASQIPLAVLAGILVTVGIGIIDYKGLRHFARIPRADAAVMIVVLGMTVFDDLIRAVAAGLVMACLIYVKRTSDRPLFPTVTEAVPGEFESLTTPAEVADGIVVIPLDGDLFFGNAAAMADLVSQMAGKRAAVIDLGRTIFLDQSGAYALSDLALDLEAEGVAVYLTDLPPEPERLLALLGIAPGEIPTERILPTVQACIEAACRIEPRRLAAV